VEDAEKLAAILKEQYGVTVSLIEYVGPVIGAHSGPGTLALFFVAKQK
jgi:fatty acid-binding protein DegV